MFLKKHLWFLVLLLSVFSILPLFSQGIFPIHDDTQIARVFEMGKALRDGMLPVRWVSDLGYGYGYPLFDYYGPLAYYVGGLFNLVGFDALISTKIMMGIGILMAGVFMYFLAREFWGEIGGIISSLFYIYASYHAVEIYVRGDVGEFWAYAFIPLIFFGLWKFYKEKKWKFIIIGLLAYFALITSHNLTAMMVTPFLIFFMSLIYFLSKKKASSLYLLLIIFLGLLLSAFYWIPAILEMKYTNVLSQIGGGADFKDHFVCINQLWDGSWGFGGSAKGCMDGMSFKIGKINIILLLISISLFVLAIFRKKFSHFNEISHHSEKAGVFLFFILGFLISVFLTLEISKPVWELIPQMAFFQYPWRFLILISFFSSLLIGFIFYLIKDERILYSSSVAVGIIIICTSLRMFTPQTFLYKPVSDFTDNYYLKWTVSKISDEYMPKDFTKPQNSDNLPKSKIQSQENLKIDYKVEKNQSVHSLVNVSRDGRYLLNIAYFPAWIVFVDNKKTSYKILDKGLLVDLKRGNHVLDARFEETSVEKISNLLSLAGLSILILGIIIFQRKRFYL